MRVKLTWISTAVLAIGLMTASQADAQVVYRWTDENGKVHYTPTLPPEASDHPYDILSPDGRVIERVTDPKQQVAGELEARNKAKEPKPLYTPEQKQALGDRLLLLKYHSEQEILAAMELEIDHLKYDERLLESGYVSAKKSLAQQIRSAANLERAGKPVPDKSRLEIRQLQSRIAANRKSNSDLNQRKEQIRTSFEADLQRFRELQEILAEAESEG